MSNNRVILPTGNAATNYGARTLETRLPSQYTSSQGDKVQMINFTFDDLPVAGGEDDSVLSIPANSYIAGATLRTVVPFVGGTSYDVGLAQADGTAIDADGLFAALLTASIDTVGETSVGGGALIGTGSGADAGQVVVASTGTFTAGEAQLEVVYRTLDNRA